MPSVVDQNKSVTLCRDAPTFPSFETSYAKLMNAFVKVFCELEQDAEGYPPITVETLWCKKVDERLIVDNTPLFASGVSCGDEIMATQKDGWLVFEAVLNESGNSSIMVLAEDESIRRELGRQLRQVHCIVEQGEEAFAGFIAVNVPEAVDYRPVRLLLESGQAEEKWLFIENAVRHSR
jgi:hypothetical protein